MSTINRQFLAIGQALCELFGPKFSGQQTYKTIMEGCFTQNSQLMARGIERLASTRAESIPLFLRGKLFLLAQSLRKERINTAVKNAEAARDYGRSLGFSRARP